MDKYIYDENNGLWYELVEDYYIPCLTLLPEENRPIGIWGQKHLHYIKQHKRVFYANLLTSCKLNSYLADVDEQAENLFNQRVKDLAEKENVTEKLKAENSMLWVQRMNNIRNRATEVVNADIVFT
ncbi:TnpV protein [Lachnospiraceae bacterium 45-W7]